MEFNQFCNFFHILWFFFILNSVQDVSSNFDFLVIHKKGAKEYLTVMNLKLIISVKKLKYRYCFSSTRTLTQISDRRTWN